MTTPKTQRLTIASALLLAFLVLPSRAVAQDLPTVKPEKVGVSSEKVEKLSTFMQSLVDEGKIAGGVTMMARHGKVVHFEAVGMADKEDKRPMRKDAIFRLASMTKPVTSVAIMMLWEQGKLCLDDPVSKYIPEFKDMKVLVGVNPLKTEPAKRDITIRHLLTHTSGLGYTSTEGVGPIYMKNGIPIGLCTLDTPLAKMIARLAKLPLLFHPGDKFQYGMSTDVMGRVVEVASGMALDRFIEDQICCPLGMNDTFFKVAADKLPRLTATYVPDQTALIRKLNQGERVIHSLIPISSDYPYADTHKCLSGGGGLCSTASDYMRFCQMLLNGGELNGVRLLRSETVRMMTANQIGKLSEGFDFGFGFGVMPNTEKVHKRLRGSFSWDGFWSTSFRISPRGDFIIITMSQLAWDDKATQAWITQYEKIAAEAIQD